MSLVDDEIFEGYLDGFHDDRAALPASMANRSDAYVFGWLNGRDDRANHPRAPAAVLRNRAEELSRQVPSLH